MTAGFGMRRLLRLANAPHAIVHHARFSASQASGLERGDKREERQRCRQHEPCTYLQCSDQLRLSFPPQRALSVPAGPTRGRPPRRPKPIPQPAGRPIRWPGRRLGGRDIVVLPSLGPLGAMHPPFRSLVNPPTIAMRESAGAPGAGARTPNIASERMRRHLPACWQAPTSDVRCRGPDHQPSERHPLGSRDAKELAVPVRSHSDPVQPRATPDARRDPRPPATPARITLPWREEQG